MRLLVISHLFPPQSNPRATRWGAIAAHWAERGHLVDVICGAAGNASYAPPPNLRVFRVGVGPLNRLRAASCHHGQLLSQPLGRKHLARGLARATRSALRGLHRVTLKQLHWPDYACLWYFPAARQARNLLQRSNYDALITVSYPFTCHLVGLGLQQQHPHVKWIADIGDPFSLPETAPVNNQRLFEGLNRATELRTLRDADFLTVTATATATAYRRIYPDALPKLHVIPPLVAVPQQFEDFCTLRDPNGKHLVFVGSLYRKIRNPRNLLRLFERLLQEPGLGNLQLHFIGRTDECIDEFRPFDHLLGKQIHLHGVISRAEAWAHLQDADVLVNLGNTTESQIPSKVVEYARTGKPILNLATRENDTSAEFFASYAAALSVVGEPTNLTPVSQFLLHPPSMDTVDIEQLLSNHRVDRIAGAYQALVEQTEKATEDAEWGIGAAA